MVRHEIARERGPRETYRACDNADSLIPSCASRFTNVADLTKQDDRANSSDHSADRLRELPFLSLKGLISICLTKAMLARACQNAFRLHAGHRTRAHSFYSVQIVPLSHDWRPVAEAAPFLPASWEQTVWR